MISFHCLIFKRILRTAMNNTVISYLFLFIGWSVLLGQSYATFMTIRDIGPSSCITECIKYRGNCEKTRYDVSNFVCYLLGAGDDGEGTVLPTYPLWLGENVHEKTAMEQCHQKNCPAYSMCEIISDSTVCVELNCPVGSYRSGAVCQPCPPGYFQDEEGQSTCKACQAGEFQPISGSTECKLCSPGYYSDSLGSLVCKKCEVGKYQNLAGQTYCNSCAQGHYQDNEGGLTCNPCPKGHAVDKTGQSVCKQCSEGTYQGQTGQTQCYPCQAGTVQPHTAQSSCIQCPPGQYQPNVGETACSECPAGNHQPQSGQNHCLQCPIGSYQPSTGKPSCIQCNAGYYQPATGQTSCLACGPGYYQSASGQTYCSLCPAGTYQSQEGQNHCPSCPTGTIAPTTGSTQCISCPAHCGYNAAKQRCLANTYTHVGKYMPGNTWGSSGQSDYNSCSSWCSNNIGCTGFVLERKAAHYDCFIKNDLSQGSYDDDFDFYTRNDC